jgi:hypothetical protein
MDATALATVASLFLAIVVAVAGVAYQTGRNRAAVLGKMSELQDGLVELRDEVRGLPCNICPTVSPFIKPPTPQPTSSGGIRRRRL